MTTNKFKPTHMMCPIGQDKVPVIVNKKRDTIWLVSDANNTQYWVGKGNVIEIYPYKIRRI
tara:strand:- start:660 stop:842 length:183 start_codon:yes stop_codon:yes gene_type:complete